MSRTADRLKNASRRLIDGDPLVWIDIKSFIGARVKRNVAMQTSRVKQITDETIKNYKISRYQPPKHGLEAFVDLEFYGQQSGVQFGTTREALNHYRRIGAGKGLSTHMLFDPIYYAQQLESDVVDTTLLEHFFNEGGVAGLSPGPYFDSAFYLSKYDWTANTNPLAHYLCYGVKDGHDPFRLFDSSFYIRAAVSSEATHRSPIEHYIMHGWQAGNDPHPLVDLEFLGAQLAPDEVAPDWTEDPLKLYLQGGQNKRFSPHPLFDPHYYYQALIDLDPDLVGPGSAFDTAEKQTPLDYYLSPGSPVVNPSREFSVEQYKFQYPDLGEMNGFYHYGRYGREEGRLAYPSMRAAMNDDLLKQLDNEPTLLAPHQSVKDMFVAFMPRKSEPGLDILQSFLEAVSDFKPDIIYCLPQFFRGGAEKYGSKLLSALSSEAPDRNILVIATDGELTDSRDWYPEAPNLKYLTCPNGTPLEILTNVIARFITMMQPEWVINLNSKACWNAYEEFGRSMAVHSKLAACLFCYDYDVNGSRVGYARDHIRSVLPFLEVVLIDNKGFCKDLHDDFSLHPMDAEKLKYLYQPFDLGESLNEVQSQWPVLAETLKKPRILWPSRFHKQKRPDLLREIALGMPEVEFLVWSPDNWSSQLAGGEQPLNVIVTNEESQLSIMAKKGVSGLLLCSAWEGLPTVLIESVSAGLPIVANDVGGVAEIVTEKSGYLVDKHAPAEAYCEAIRELISSSESAEARRNVAFKSVGEQHSQTAYTKRLQAIGLL